MIDVIAQERVARYASQVTAASATRMTLVIVTKIALVVPSPA